MIRRPPSCTLFPYTPLFRSHCGLVAPTERRSEVLPSRSGVPIDSERAQPMAHRITTAERRAWSVAIELGEARSPRSEEHTSELQSRQYLVCRLLLEKKTDAY